MPDNPSPFDDPLADLHGKLTDQRREAAQASQPETPPLSRRAAREARAETSAVPVQQPAAQPATPPNADGPAAETRPGAEPVTTPAPPRAAPRASAPAASNSPTASARPASSGRPTASPSPSASSRPGRATATASRPAATGTLDELFTGERSIDDVGTVPPPAERRRRRIGGWIALAIVLALIGGIVGGGVWAWNTFGVQVQGFFSPAEREDFEDGIATGETSVTIVAGDAGQSVSQKLFDAGVVKAPTSLYDYMIDTSTSFTFQPGVFRLQQQMSSEAVLAALRDPANRLEGTAQIREGLTAEQTVAQLAEQLSIPVEDFTAAIADPAAYGVPATSLEGWLFPATYTFEPETTANQVIQRMVERTIQSLDEHGVAVADRQRVLTVASIVEREARLADDFYRVSRVIQNRLDQGMKLQMDSTSQYGYGELHEGSVSTSGEAQFDDNAWNTYVVDGLPAGPISNPGDQAIDAAINPAEGDWLFFVTVNLDTGETVFTSNADDHEGARQQWIQWCQDNPDSGC